mgnify:CR=1 FL=1
MTVINVVDILFGSPCDSFATSEIVVVHDGSTMGIDHIVVVFGNNFPLYILPSDAAGIAALRKEIGIQVNTEIGNIARPDRVQFTPGLPKTRSGKIMRRILRKVASGEHDQLGDTSTLLDPSVVHGVIAGAAEFLD